MSIDSYCSSDPKQAAEPVLVKPRRLFPLAQDAFGVEIETIREDFLFMGSRQSAKTFLSITQYPHTF